MKKFTILLIIFTILPLNLAWNDCPYGITNSSCLYPGYCNLYIDTNNNNICDHCEPAPESIVNLEEGNTNNGENSNQDRKSFMDRVVEFLFMEVNLKKILWDLLEKIINI
ncbi:hypothetical protein KKP90_04825 [Methanothermococcus sp. SCGC AD-155-E23]|nr:hypothetical protein [Methanothermococcus sp. SCGC AD-155-E23]